MRKIGIRGRDNLALTVMMPSPCKATCKFCTVRNFYTNHASNPADLWYQFQRLVKFSQWPSDQLKPEDIVFSGGEPFYDLRLLSNMVTMAKANGFKTYVNTILPVVGNGAYEESNYWDQVKELAQHLDGINISRHSGSHQTDCAVQFGVRVVSDSFIKELAKLTKVRINSMANPNGLITQVDMYSKRWEHIATDGGDIELAIRLDYDQIAVDNNMPGICKLPVPLMQNRDVIPLFGWQDDKGNNPVIFLERTRCAVCESLKFQKRNGFKFRIHQGSKRSSRILGLSQIEINDLILMHNGVLCYDWGFDCALSTPVTPKAGGIYETLSDDLESAMDILAKGTPDFPSDSCQMFFLDWDIIKKQLNRQVGVSPVFGMPYGNKPVSEKTSCDCPACRRQRIRDEQLSFSWKGSGGSCGGGSCGGRNSGVSCGGGGCG